MKLNLIIISRQYTLCLMSRPILVARTFLLNASSNVASYIVNPDVQRLMSRSSEDDIYDMTSQEMADGPSLFDHNVTAAAVVGGESASRWRTGTLGLIAAVTSVVTVGGNLIVILSFVLERTIRQPSNYFIASLAVSDLLIGQSRGLLRLQHGLSLSLYLSCLHVP